MGYYILGIILFLLAIVFVSDLVTKRGNKGEYMGDDPDEFIDNYTADYQTRYYGTGYLTEFADDLTEKQISEETGKTNDMGVEPLYQNLEQQALQTSINYGDKELEDVLPEDPDEDDIRR